MDRLSISICDWVGGPSGYGCPIRNSIIFPIHVKFALLEHVRTFAELMDFLLESYEYEK